LGVACLEPAGQIYAAGKRDLCLWKNLNVHAQEKQCT
jgi:hypothetical protein